MGGDIELTYSCVELIDLFVSTFAATSRWLIDKILNI